MGLSLVALCAAASGLGVAAQAQHLRPAPILAAHYGADADWYRGRIPLFASSDPVLDSVWYYRWAIYRAHQRDLGAAGFISTEFFDDVGWQREPYASLNDATGFHLYEGRWLRDRRYAGDYIDFLYDRGGNDRHFSEAIADAVWARYLADGDAPAAVRHLGAMRHVFNLWDDHFDPARGLYWIEPLLDATEYSVASIDATGGQDGFTGGHAFRPSISAYMVANAHAISHIAALAGDSATAQDYAARADTLTRRMGEALWSPTLGHFIDRHRTTNAHVQAWEPIRDRELVGYAPWAYGAVGADPRYDAAWAHLLSPDGFAGPHGLRTAEPSYRYYMRQYRYDKATGLRECQWNGPVWPFQTTQALMAMERRLHASGAPAPFTRADYWRLLRQYAALHGADGRLDLQEDYDPATGQPIVGLARSHHYFHSGFNDLVITGLVGVVPSAGKRLRIDPLLPPGGPSAGGLDWFTLQDLPYHGCLLTITYDRSGAHGGRGLRAYVDGRLAAARGDLGPLVLRVPGRVQPTVARPINRAVQLWRDGWPHLSASSGADREKLHQAVDGRTGFFRELPNGWDSTSSQNREWFAMELEKPGTIRAASLAFAVDQNFAMPRRIAVQALQAGQWRTVASTTPSPAHQVVPLRWRDVRGQSWRIVMDKAGRQVRLVEASLY